MGLEPICLRAAEQRSYTPSSTLTSSLFLATKSTGEWKPIKYLSNLNAIMYCPAALWKHLHPANRNSLRFCQNGTTWQFTVLSYGLLISPRVFTKILKPVLACAKNTHLHGSSYIYVTGRLKESSSLNSFKYRLKKSLFPTRSKTHDNDRVLPL